MTTEQLFTDDMADAIVKRAFGIKHRAWTNHAGVKCIECNCEVVSGPTWELVLKYAHMLWPAECRLSRPTTGSKTLSLLTWLGNFLTGKDYQTELRHNKLVVSDFKRTKGETLQYILEGLNVKEFTVWADNGDKYSISLKNQHNVITVSMVVPVKE
jgi:hypothetical protein